MNKYTAKRVLKSIIITITTIIIITNHPLLINCFIDQPSYEKDEQNCSMNLLHT